MRRVFHYKISFIVTLTFNLSLILTLITNLNVKGKTISFLTKETLFNRKSFFRKAINFGFASHIQTRVLKCSKGKESTNRLHRLQNSSFFSYSYNMKSGVRNSLEDNDDLSINSNSLSLHIVPFSSSSVPRQTDLVTSANCLRTLSTSISFNSAPVLYIKGTRAKELTLVFVRRQFEEIKQINEEKNIFIGEDETNIPKTNVNTIVRKQILLGYKKRGFGQGLWNGFGGKVETTDLSIKHAALRELEEESGILPDSIEEAHDVKKLQDSQKGKKLKKEDCINWCGTLLFTFRHIPDVMRVHVFELPDGNWKGKEIETEEMRPKWFDEIYQGSLSSTLTQQTLEHENQLQDQKPQVKIQESQEKILMNQNLASFKKTNTLNSIPFEKMWKDDAVWLPLLLNGEKFEGKFEFDDENTILYHHIKKLDLS